jgi:hypothetical protein
LPPAADPADVRAEFGELRKILEQLQTPDQGEIRRALDDAAEGARQARGEQG